MQNDAVRKQEPIVVGEQWSQCGHAMQHHGVTNNGHVGHHRPTQRSGRKNLKSKEPLSEAGKSAHPWLQFSKTGSREGSLLCMHVLVALDTKVAIAKRVLLQFLTQEILDPRAMPCRVVVSGSL